MLSFAIALAAAPAPQARLSPGALQHQKQAAPELAEVRVQREAALTARAAFRIDRGVLEDATLRGNDVVVRVPLSKLPVRELEYGELTATGWKDASSRVATSGDDALLTLPKDTTFVMRPKEPESLRLGTERTFCAGTLLHPTGASDASGAPVVRQWSLFLSTRNDPLTWNAEAQAYATRLVVGVEDADGAAVSESLPQPVTVQFFLHGSGLEVEPAQLAVARSGAEGYVEAALLCRTHDVADAAIRARGSFGEQLWSFDVAPALGELRVELSPPTILGFGLESGAVVVRRCADDGREWSHAEPLAVTLAASRGTLPALLEIPAGASFATAPLRSSSVGLVTVTASAQGRRSEAAPVLYAWPIGMLGVTILFGALGGLLRAVQDERKRAKARRSGGRVAFRAAAGAFTALVLVAAAVVGISQVGLDALTARTEAGAAVVAALAGWVGTLALSALAKKLGIDPDEPAEVKPINS